MLQDVLYRPKAIEDVMQSVAASRSAAERLCDELEDREIGFVTETDEAYPRKLKKLMGKDCPPVLFLKWNKDLLDSDSVGFCGSRNVSEKGREIAAKCAWQLADNGITVVSGYAKGTDLAAHRAALEAGGNTVFVLTEGILEYRRKREVEQLLNDGNHLFVSQFLPHSIWSASNAMQRNSMIIGLSKAMILIESGRSERNKNFMPHIRILGLIEMEENSGILHNCSLFLISY